MAPILYNRLTSSVAFNYHQAQISINGTFNTKISTKRHKECICSMTPSLVGLW